MLEIVAADELRFVIVSVWAALVVPRGRSLPNASPPGCMFNSLPVPERLTVCGLPAPLKFTVIVPVRKPMAVGVNVTLMVQPNPPRANGLKGQLVVSAKSPEPVMLVIGTRVVPVMDTEITCS